MKEFKFLPEEAEKIKLLVESPGGKILTRLGREITPEAVYEVEIVLLQHYLDRLIVRKYGEKEIGLEEIIDLEKMGLDKITDLAVEIGKIPQSLREPQVTSVPEYVETFYYSGTARIHAQLQLSSLGLKALAEPEGIEYLAQKFPPKKKTE